MKTKYIELSDAKIAYREIGKGRPLIMCNRFRGTLDTWDPLFLSSMAEHFKVIIFDYPEIGYSTGKFPKDITGLAKILHDIIQELGLNEVVLAGWSFGGFVVQAAALEYEGLASHLILIGSNPPGKNPHTFESIFLEKALLPNYTLEDEIILFFEPESKFSVESGKVSHDRIYESIDVGKIPTAKEVFNMYFVAGDAYKEDKEKLRKRLTETGMPVLVLHGDHDVSFPIENWFLLLRQMRNAQLVIFTKTGHGPQHQYPELSSEYIADFVGNSFNID
ncbi:alpha/beta hydrolase [Muricauda oceani]|uniref:Alpha/beta hydrolase n=1 Tax=Flagellimonas oceani TaxID=2698672 RepID=A0A6G7IZ60_9FLAO|nr:alpha/beta hydrolase [Allomuricauda oceani]MBW8244797.1 alpha/beta hydrolase [Allomuricauda oceani]QII43891.1 alpha/beta hydrolase [Allomuricauda oceani]